MNRRCLNVLLMLSTAVVSASTALAQNPPAEDPVARNAALKYWLAFDLLPLHSLDDKRYDAVDAALSTLGPVDDKLAELLHSSEEALLELHRGAKLPRCVWALSTEDGPNVLMPHLQRARLLAKVSCLRAQWYFQQGKSAEAIDDLIATMTLARHVSDPTMISLLVDYAIERQAIRVAAGNLNKLEPAALKRLSQGIERLPVATTAHQAVIGEKQVYLEWLIRTLSEPGGKEKMLRLSDGLGEQALKALKGLSEEQLREGAVNLRPVYDKLAAAVDLPLPEAEKAEKDLMSEAQLRGPARTVALWVLPAALPVRSAEIKQLTRWAMLNAAIAVCESGEAALSAESHKDPILGGPFQYEKTPHGFRLQSKTLETDGRPLTLEVGRSAGK